MNAHDVMASPVVTVKPYSSVREVAQLLLSRRISAVPVVDDQGMLVGIVSEGDLMHRAEAGTERRYSWWLRPFVSDWAAADNYARAHASKVADIMVRDVITATPETPVQEIAAILEKNRIKRVPIVKNGQVVGIVSRANLIQAVASHRELLEVPLSDTEVRNTLLDHLKHQGWAHTSLLNVIVNGGVVDLWGFSESEAERKAIRIAAEQTPGVCAVNDHLMVQPIARWS